MKLSEVLHEQENLEVKLPPTLKIQPSAFLEMWSQNQAHRRITNPELVFKVKEAWESVVGGKISIQESKIEIDTRHLKQVDAKTKQVNEIKNLDILNTDIGELAVGRAMLTLQAKGLHEDYQPTLAIILTENGEKFGFGTTVSICSNLTIFGAEYVLDTQTINKNTNKKWLTADAVAFFKANILAKTTENFEIQMAEIEELKTKFISEKEFLAFMGKLHQQIEFVNNTRLKGNGQIRNLSKAEKDLAVNSRQLAKVAIEAKKPSHEEYSWQNGYNSLWSVVNFGTEHLKASIGSDMATLLETNLAWVNTVKNYPFALENRNYLTA